MAKEDSQRTAEGEHPMKPLPTPFIPGNTEAERFDNAVRKIFTVSKTDVLKEEAKWKAAKRKKRAKAKANAKKNPS